MGAANSPAYLLLAPVGLIIGGIVGIAAAPEVIPAFLLVGTFIVTGTIIAQEITYRIKNKDMDRMEMIRPKLYYRRLKKETVSRLKSTFDTLKKISKIATGEVAFIHIRELSSIAEQIPILFCDNDAFSCDY